MVAIKNIVLFVTAASALVVRRSAATIETDLKTIDTALNKLTKDANAWSGSIFTAGTISSDANALESDIKQATSDTQASSALSSADSATIVGYVKSPIMNDINTALKALQARKNDIKNDGLTSTVQGAIKDIKSETDSFGAALKPLLTSDQASTFAGYLSTIDSEFDTAINSFS